MILEDLILFYKARKNPAGYVQLLQDKHKKIVSRNFGFKKAHLLYSHEEFQKVLMNPDLFRKSFAYKKMVPLLGQGLVTAEGEVWKEKRKLYSSLFHLDNLKNFIPLFEEISLRVLEESIIETEKNGSIDLSQKMVDIALESICQSIIGLKINDESAEVKHALSLFMEAAEKQVLSLINWPYWLPIPRHLKLRKSVKILDEVLGRLLEKDWNNPDKTPALMQKIESIPINKKEKIKYVRDEVMTFFVAGHETTATTLVWFWTELQKNPAVLSWLKEEHFEGDRMRSALYETLRLYPAVWLTSREANQATEIGDCKISKDALIILSFYNLNRNENYWKNPNTFQADRFLETKSLFNVPGFMSFGYGPRNCIGAQFALLEMQAVTRVWLSKAKIEILPEQDLNPNFSLTLRPRGAIKARVIRREDP